MRNFVHIGLAVIVAITPVLCCCQTRFISGPIVATFKSNQNSALSPKDTPQPPASCCHKEDSAKLENHSSCCPEKPFTTFDNTPFSIPHSTPPGQCCCSMERVDTAQPEPPLQLAPHEWTGELVPHALLG